MKSPETTPGRESLPHILTSVDQMNHMYSSDEPTTDEEYEKKGFARPSRKSFAVNNNVLAVCDSEGKISVALPTEKTPDHRLEELQAAVDQLKAMGYSEEQFHVPSF